MIVTVRDAEGAIIVAAEGRLDTATAPDLEGVCARQLEGGACRLILDLGGLEYVSSAGLRVILALAKRLQAAGGGFALCGATGLVRETLDLAGIGTIVAVHDSLDEALGEED